VGNGSSAVTPGDVVSLTCQRPAVTAEDLAV
jgi:hypothetical protein